MKAKGYIKLRHKGSMIERFIKQYDIVVCELGEGLGCEKRGSRPCVVVGNDKLNKNSDNILIAPLTNMVNKRNEQGTIDLLDTHVVLSNKFYRQLPKTSIVQLEDVRSISKSRIVEWFGDLSKNDKDLIKNAQRVAFGL